MNDEISFGQFISEMRNKHSMKISESAQLLGISRAYLCQLERGIRIDPSVELLGSIAMVLYLDKREREAMYMRI